MQICNSIRPLPKAMPLNLKFSGSSRLSSPSEASLVGQASNPYLQPSKPANPPVKSRSSSTSSIIKPRLESLPREDREAMEEFFKSIMIKHGAFPLLGAKPMAIIPVSKEEVETGYKAYLRHKDKFQFKNFSLIRRPSSDENYIISI